MRSGSSAERYCYLNPARRVVFGACRLGSVLLPPRGQRVFYFGGDFHHGQRYDGEVKGRLSPLEFLAVSVARAVSHLSAFLSSSFKNYRGRFAGAPCCLFFFPAVLGLARPSVLPPPYAVCRLPLPRSCTSHKGQVSRERGINGTVSSSRLCRESPLMPDRDVLGLGKKGERHTVCGGARWRNIGVLTAGKEAVRPSLSRVARRVARWCGVGAVEGLANRYARRMAQRSEAKADMRRAKRGARFIYGTHKHGASGIGRFSSFSGRFFRGLGECPRVGRMPKAKKTRIPGTVPEGCSRMAEGWRGLVLACEDSPEFEFLSGEKVAGPQKETPASCGGFRGVADCVSNLIGIKGYRHESYNRKIVVGQSFGRRFYRSVVGVLGRKKLLRHDSQIPERTSRSFD